MTFGTLLFMLVAELSFVEVSVIEMSVVELLVGGVYKLNSVGITLK